jgi:hypothetical protein
MEPAPVYIEDYTLLISPLEIITNIFDPVIDKVLSLVDSQFKNVDETLDAIFLVGGFGQSAYLFTNSRICSLLKFDLFALLLVEKWLLFVVLF